MRKLIVSTKTLVTHTKLDVSNNEQLTSVSSVHEYSNYTGKYKVSSIGSVEVIVFTLDTGTVMFPVGDIAGIEDTESVKIKAEKAKK